MATNTSTPNKCVLSKLTEILGTYYTGCDGVDEGSWCLQELIISHNPANTSSTVTFKEADTCRDWLNRLIGHHTTITVQHCTPADIKAFLNTAARLPPKTTFQIIKE